MKLQIHNQMKSKAFLFLVFFAAFGFSQTHKANLSPVQKDGFYKIEITPEIRSASQDNLDFFRILDSKNKEVPFVNFDDLNSSTSSFRRIEILSNTTIKDSVTSIIIPVSSLKNNRELILTISNTKIDKTYSISGSNNQKDWFGLVSNQVLTDLNNDDGISVDKIISFPQNNYQFLRLDFNDKKSLPINVLKIRYFTGNPIVIENIEVPDFKYKISEDKKHKKTIITFSSDNFQRVDGISFDVKTKFFFRNGSIFIKKTRKVKKKTENFKLVICDLKLTSNSLNTLNFNGFFEKEFTIEINNQDNQPLEISKIKVFQNAISVVADLKVNEKYEIIIDSTLSKPEYDLVNFSQNITSDLPKASILNLKKLDAKSKSEFEKSFWQKPVFLWSAILFATVLLAYFVFSMLKDVEKK